MYANRWAAAFLIFLLFLASACTEEPASKAPPSPAVTGSGAPLGQVKELVDSAAAVSLPGVVTAVREGTRTTVLAAGVSELEKKTPMTAKHRFRLASLTKPMVAALVLTLVEDGRLALSDTVEQHLPGLIRRGDQITVEHLLSHRSGLQEPYGVEAFRSLYAAGRATPTRAARAGAALPLMFDPGTASAYQNINYVVLGLVVEQITGRSLSASLEQRIFAPLGMDSASLEVGRHGGAPMAHGYFQGHDATGEDIGFDEAAGGAVMNARDAATFFDALLGGRIIGQSLLGEMTAERSGSMEDWQQYGLGLAHEDWGCGTALGHGGLMAGWVAEAWALESGDRIVVALGNRADSRRSGGALSAIVDTALCG